MENKKLIGYVVKNEELYKISNIIVKKALKIMESKGNMFASEILEKNLDIMQDLKQEIVLNLLENNYIVTKGAFQTVNNYLYNKVKKIKEFERISIESENENDIELLNYISFLAYNDKKIMIENEKQEKSKDIINMLNLTERQREILDIYAKTMNKTKTAEFLGISKQAIDITINKIKEKVNKLNIQIA